MISNNLPGKLWPTRQTLHIPVYRPCFCQTWRLVPQPPHLSKSLQTSLPHNVICPQRCSRYHRDQKTLEKIEAISPYHVLFTILEKSGDNDDDDDDDDKDSLL